MLAIAAKQTAQKIEGASAVRVQAEVEENLVVVGSAKTERYTGASSFLALVDPTVSPATLDPPPTASFGAIYVPIRNVRAVSSVSLARLPATISLKARRELLSSHTCRSRPMIKMSFRFSFLNCEGALVIIQQVLLWICEEKPFRTSAVQCYAMLCSAVRTLLFCCVHLTNLSGPFVFSAQYGS